MSEPKYTVFVRVPIPRRDFVDPPPVHWDSTKDDALWRILSGATNNDIDWNKVAEQFDVPVDFLLQQVAYVTERHASQVQAQLRKATAAAKGSTAPSPVPGAEPPGVPVRQRMASMLSGRRDSPLPRTESKSVASGEGTNRPEMSRGTSANTTILRDASDAASPRPSITIPSRPMEQGGRRRLSSLPIASPTVQSPNPGADSIRDDAGSPGPAESTSNDTSDDESSPAQSRIIRRPPRFQSQEAVAQYEDDGDDESEPAFRVQASGQDMVSTLRGNARGQTPTTAKGISKQFGHHSTISDDSSASSPSAVQRDAPSRDARPLGPLSPRRTAELAGRSPSGKGKGTSQEGSDGTPSMGSSFSDLDDASVTQSALEEALASHMKGAASSRFSISQAFRSRYAPGSNQ